jgi:16S rRNA (uracil1498-N3)-methyltransferase
MADRFYTPQPLALGDITLDGPEAHHLSTVRRFEPGDAVTLFNGDGREYAADVVAVDRKRATLHVRAVLNIGRESPVNLTVASALPKGDRADYLVEKLTELGVTRFIPLVTVRSVVVPKATTVEKLARVVIEASKQCGRNRLMTVGPPTTFRDFLTRRDGVQLILHTAGGGVVAPPSCAAGVSVAVGPEGGFGPEEIAAALEAGRTVLSLGPRVLRVETAAVVAAAWVQSHFPV